MHYVKQAQVAQAVTHIGYVKQALVAEALTLIGYVKQTQVAEAVPNHSVFKPTSPSCHLTAIPYLVVYQIGSAPISMSKYR